MNDVPLNTAEFIDGKLQESFLNILNCFSGADGGIRFVYFKMMLHSLEQSATENDQSAKMLLEMVHRFSRLIDVANTK